MWQELGIAPTREAERIRSAFRDRMLALKRAGLHEDVAHVQPLREAYQAALQWAAGHHPDNADAQAWADRGLADAPSHDSANAPAAPAHGRALEEQATLAVSRLLVDGNHPPHLPRRWRSLSQRPEWQSPEAARALQDALAIRLLERHPFMWRHKEPCEAVVAEVRRGQRWLSLTLYAAETLGWWQGGQDTGRSPLGSMSEALWQLVCRTEIDHLIVLLNRGLVAAACHQLNEYMQHPVMQGLDRRSSWLQACAAALAHWPDVPVELLTALLTAHGLLGLPPGVHPDPAVDALVVRHQRLMRRGLLLRLATGEEAHAQISAAVAATLLQEHISAEDERAVRDAQTHGGMTQLARVRLAITWLNLNAPEALEPLKPEVLIWWRMPQLTRRFWWEPAAMVTAMCGGTAGLALFGWTVGEAHAQARTWGALLGLMACVLSGMALGGLLGWWLGVGISWLRMQWATDWYIAWGVMDARWARRIPVLGALLPRLHIWLTRDLAVLAGLILLIDSPDWAPYLAFACWRLALRWAARDEY